MNDLGSWILGCWKHARQSDIFSVAQFKLKRMCPRLTEFMKHLTFLPNLSGSHQAKAAEWLFDQKTEQEKMDKCARKFKTLPIKVIGLKKFPSFRLSALKAVYNTWSVGPSKTPLLHKIFKYFFSPHAKFQNILPLVSYWQSFRIIFPYYWPDTRYKNNQCWHLRCFAILQDSHSQNSWFLVVLIPARKSFCSPLIPCVKFKATKEKIGEHIFPPLHCLNWTFLDTKFTFCAYHHIIKQGEATYLPD